MRFISLFSTFAVLFVPLQLQASPRIIPQPWPAPLGVFVAQSKTIHTFEVESVDAKGVTFKVTAALKGKLAEAPFKFAELIKGGHNCEGYFRVGDLVLCFREGEIATLFVRGRWAYAVEPIRWRGEEHWFCLSTTRLNVTYEGPTGGLRDHVAAILAGGERTITARPPTPTDTVEQGRLWRIKASLKVTRFVTSDESPHFVGWGNGDPKEAILLAEALRSGELQDRVAAAEELARLGGEARPALPVLRDVLKDDQSAVVLTAARALVLVDPQDGRGINTLVARLKDGDAAVRAAAARSLARTGPPARAALPALLAIVKDGDASVRKAVVAALGHLAPGTDAEEATLTAFGAIIADRTEEIGPAHAFLHALRRFGSRAWSVAPQLRQAFPILDKEHQSVGDEVVDRLGRLNPPAIEFLADVLTDERSSYQARQAAVNHLVALGPRARLVLPRLRQGLARSRDSRVVELGHALLAIDPENAPALIAPVLLKVLESKEDMMDQHNLVWLLGRCGPAGKPALTAILPTLEPGGFWTSHTVQCLVPLLGPKDRDLLPRLRDLLAEDKHHPFLLADVLLRLELRDEAIAQAAAGLKSKYPPQRAATAEWLGKQGEEARAVEAELRQALAKATGSQRTRVALALWRVTGSGTGTLRDQAFAALEIQSGEAPGWWEETDFGEALAEVESRLLANADPIPALERSLRDRNPHVRLISVGILVRLKPQHPDTVPVLRELLTRHPDYFTFAESTLSELGPKAQPLLEVLRSRLRTEGRDHYVDTVRVLRRIDPGLMAREWGAAGATGAVPEDLSPLWDDLAATDGFCADLARWRLAGGGPRTVALVRKRLQPPRTFTPEQLAQLIADLDSNTFATRERATLELGKSLETTASALRAAREKNPPPEVRKRLDGLLEMVDRSTDREQRQRWRAIQLMTEIECPEARAFLDELACDARFTSVLQAVGSKRTPGDQ
jgi:HEAT repeat protein